MATLTNNELAVLQGLFGTQVAAIFERIAESGDFTGQAVSASTVVGTTSGTFGGTSLVDVSGFYADNPSGSISKLFVATGAVGTQLTLRSDSTTIYDITTTATAITETITDATGEYSTALTANRADAHSVTDGTNDVYVIETTTAAPGIIVGGNAGAATTMKTMVGKKTAIADNTATDIITVTVPNANVAAAIRLTLVGSLGTGTDTFESTRAALGMVVLARQTGANVVPTAIALTNAGIATVSGGGTLTLAYAVSTVTGAVGATNTFTITVTLVKTGTITDLQCMYVAELINAEAGGATIARA